MWANAQRYYPLHVVPYTPEGRLPGGKQDPAFRTKPQLALALVEQAITAGIPFQAIVADCAYGDNGALEATLRQRRLPYVLAHRGTASCGWAPAEVAHSIDDAARELPLRAWQRIVRRFRDGHAERWWAGKLTFLHCGPNKPARAVCITTDRRALPELSTWYLITNLSLAQASLTEVARLYGKRLWIEQGYKQIKDELGWADFMVRSDRAIRRHWTLVCCAFAFCWWHEAAELRVRDAVTPARGKNPAGRIARAPPLAASVARGACVADAGALAHALLAGVLEQAPAARTRRAH